MGKLRHQFQLRTALLCKKSSYRLVLQQMLDQAITTVNMGSSNAADARDASRKLIKEDGKRESLEKEEEKFKPFTGRSFKITDK